MINQRKSDESQLSKKTDHFVLCTTLENKLNVSHLNWFSVKIVYEPSCLLSDYIYIVYVSIVQDEKQYIFKSFSRSFITTLCIQKIGAILIR
jgi:hypothetical protein